MQRREFIKTSSAIAGALSAFGVSPLLTNNLRANDLKANNIKTNNPKQPTSTTKNTTKLPARKLGASGIYVSAMGLGCMGMSANHGPARDKKDMINLIAKAIDLGINFFDTAEIYGPYTNEILLGEALKPYRKQVILGTKFGLYYPFGKQMQDSKPKSILRAIDASLKRLQSDYIDIYTQHRVDIDTPIEEVADLMGGLIKQGKIRAWGLSEPSAKTLAKAHKVCPVSAVQSQYSMAFREPEENGIFDTCKKEGIAFVAYSPLDRGFLTGKMNKNTTFHPTLDMRSNFPRYTPEALEANQSIIRFIASIAQSKKIEGKPATIAQVALAWILSYKSFTIPIPETTKMPHLIENLGALSLHFSKDEMKAINQELSTIKLVGERYAPNSDAAKSVGL
ncbi:aldo/keto reductase [Helicobacter sp. MIT 14-3879]|uniref:aldo/keto reductase n=1 Tax=Helicobacter sp. MIT 14-3879 TaxID=2040649 RepID=UPI000E1EBE44|nr:aldo/keto reductase [Helicobacter sp. MIT 14-3879]RDU65238.1 aldo/keto reductase [Helicobacter sp. MIT 14-3879]